MRAFEILRSVKAVTISTSENNIPHSRIIDIMHYDETGVYFITSKTKPFYRQLINNPHVSFNTMNEDYVQVRIDGEVKVTDSLTIEEIFERNPSLSDLFPDGADTYDIFKLYKGKGELFDLSGTNQKLYRERFSFGDEEVNEAGCIITDSCIECGICMSHCPFDAITSGTPYVIDPNKCDECGICFAACPVDAIEIPKGL